MAKINMYDFNTLLFYTGVLHRIDFKLKEYVVFGVEETKEEDLSYVFQMVHSTTLETKAYFIAKELFMEQFNELKQKLALESDNKKKEKYTYEDTQARRDNMSNPGDKDYDS